MQCPSARLRRSALFRAQSLSLVAILRCIASAVRYRHTVRAAVHSHRESSDSQSLLCSIAFLAVCLASVIQCKHFAFAAAEPNLSAHSLCFGPSMASFIDFLKTVDNLPQPRKEEWYVTLTTFLAPHDCTCEVELLDFDVDMILREVPLAN